MAAALACISMAPRAKTHRSGRAGIHRIAQNPAVLAVELDGPSADSAEEFLIVKWCLLRSCSACTSQVHARKCIDVVMQAYAAARESPAILATELGGLGAVSAGAAGGGSADFRVRGSLSAREAVAVLVVEEGAELEMAMRLPTSWPLRPPSVECRRRVCL